MIVDMIVHPFYKKLLIHIHILFVEKGSLSLSLLKGEEGFSFTLKKISKKTCS
jgi:hypothetical protein